MFRINTLHKILYAGGYFSLLAFLMFLSLILSFFLSISNNMPHLSLKCQFEFVNKPERIKFDLLINSRSTIKSYRRISEAKLNLL